MREISRWALVGLVYTAAAAAIGFYNFYLWNEHTAETALQRSSLSSEQDIRESEFREKLARLNSEHARNQGFGHGFACLLFILIGQIARKGETEPIGAKA